MDTQRSQEACLLEFHTSSKGNYLPLSIFISILINISVLIILYLFHPRITALHNGAYTVDIVQTQKSENAAPTLKSRSNIQKINKPHKTHNIAAVKKYYASNIIDRGSKNIPIKHYANNILKKKTTQDAQTNSVNRTEKKTHKAVVKNINTGSIKDISTDKSSVSTTMLSSRTYGAKHISIKKPINISQSQNKNLYDWIASHKYYPMEALYKNEQGNVLLNFVINSNGTISLVKISKYSEYDSLNRAAVKIIERSSPIPKSVLNISKIKLPMTCLLKMTFKIQ